MAKHFVNASVHVSHEGFLRTPLVPSTATMAGNGDRLFSLACPAHLHHGTGSGTTTAPGLLSSGA